MAVSMAPMGVVPLRISKMAGAPPQTMEHRPCGLVDGDPCQAFGGVLHHGSQQGDGGGGPRQRHGDHSGQGRGRGPESIRFPAPKLAPDERGGRAHIKERVAFLQRFPSAGKMASISCMLSRVVRRRRR